MKKHINSRIVYLKTAPTTTQQNIMKANDYRSEPSVNIGSYLVTGQIHTGKGDLTRPELEAIMPSIVLLQPGDHGFWNKVEEYFQDLTCSASLVGEPLEVGLDGDNDAALTYKRNGEIVIQKPLNSEHYVKWRVLMNHPKVARTQEEAMVDSRKIAYLFDPYLENKAKTTKLQIGNDAMAKYLNISNEPEKIELYLLRFGVNPMKLSTPPALKLKELVEQEPELFLEYVEDKYTETKSLINKLINFEILKQIGTTYISVEDNSHIAHSIEEAVAWFANKDNAKSVQALKNALARKIKQYEKE